MSKILIRNTNILDFSKDVENVRNVDIFIDENKIKLISKNIKEPPNERIKVVNGKNKLTFPGLINCHTHIPMVLMRGYADDLPLNIWLNKKIFPVERRLDPESIYMGTLLGLAELIRTGCTTFVDMYFFMEEVASAVKIAGLRCILSYGIIGINGKKGLIDSENFFNNFNNYANGRVKVYLGPHAPYTCSLEYLKEVATLSKKLNTGVHIHLNETKSEIEELTKDFGKPPILKVSETGLMDGKTVAAHCVHLTQEEIEILKEKNVLVAHNPSSNMKLASGIAPVQDMLNKGIKVSIGTDGAASNNSLNMWHEMRLASFLSKVSTLDATSLPAREILKMTTSVPGNYLWDGAIGEIKEGSLADLILIDLNNINLTPAFSLESNLTYATYGNEIDTVIVDGNIIMENNKILSFDEELIKKEARKQAERIIGKKVFLNE